jgi:hypothetical protein
MSTPSEAAKLTSERDNDYFTSTIVGLPSEIALGRAYAKRKLSQHPTLTIDATTAAVWHSDAARALLKQQIKQSPYTLGLPFPAGSFARRRSSKSTLWAFLFGFCLCAVLCFAFVTQPWLQAILLFK